MRYFMVSEPVLSNIERVEPSTIGLWRPFNRQLTIGIRQFSYPLYATFDLGL